MLKDKFKKTFDKKEIDKNEYWLIKNNPMTKIGVFPYLGSQISPELEPNKVYGVLRSKEELTRPETLKSLELIPLINEHTMIGNKEGMTPAEDVGVEGVTGTNVQINDPFITNDLKIFSENLKQEIESGKKELSMGYFCDYELKEGELNGKKYSAIQKNIIYNHIALVGEGRMGSDVRVMDGFTFDSLSDITNTKKGVNSMENEKQTKDTDKRELIREIMAIAAKPDTDFEGGEEEKIETIAKKLETIAYTPSEAGNNDEDDTPPETKKEGEDEEEEEGKNPCEDEEEDPKKPCEDEEEEGKKEEENGGVSMDAMIKYIAKKENLISRIKPVIGENAKYSEMTIPEVVKYACDKLNIKNSTAMLEGYLTAVEKKPKVLCTFDNSLINSAAASPVLKAYKNKK